LIACGTRHPSNRNNTVTLAAKVLADTRESQARRVADFLEIHPGATAREINAACDVGSIAKVLSDMGRPGGLGYGFALGNRREPCNHGFNTRRVKTYTLTHRPEQQPDLFTAA
jgi:hypothetical protein